MAFFTRTRIIIAAVVVLVGGGIGYAVLHRGASTAGILTEAVKRQDIAKTVLATGQVTSTTDLSLAFKTSGIVRSITGKVGDKVTTGQVLAQLDQRDVAASVTQARGSVAQAQANYQKVLDGASSEEVQIAQTAVDAAQVRLDNAKVSFTITKNQQDIAVANANQALLNSTPEAFPQPGNQNTTNPTVSGTYTGPAGSYRIEQQGYGYIVSGLETSGRISFDTPTPVAQPLGSRGLYLSFPSGMRSANDVWVVELPNKRAANYVTNVNTYNATVEARAAALQTAQNEINNAQVALDQANATLAQRKAQARPAEIAAAQAQLLSARGQLEAALANLENGIIRAPANGTITTVDIKVGEQAQALKNVVVVQDIDNLHVEANVSEASIASVALGQTVTFTFDALGPDRVFTGTVQAVDPASTVVSGVVNYKVTAAIEKLPEIRPGMTANMTILTAERKSVLAIPQRAVISKNNSKIVRVVTDEKTKAYKEMSVETGLEADGGLVEVTSGVSEGEVVVTFIPTK